MERHCAGGRLAEALRRQPTCPDCGLALGDDIELVQPDEILLQCRQALSEELAELAARRERLEEALGSEGDAAKQKAVRRALDLPPDAPAESVLEAFAPPVVEWLATALRAQAVGAPTAGARLRLVELQTFLRGKRLTREQALRAFAEWLSAHGAAQDDDPIEFE
jgi:hypothetical protein